MEKLFQSFIALNLVLAITAGFNEHCPQECKCAWVKGKKHADCTNGKLQALPNNLSAETQVLDLTSNELNEIKENAFENAGLMNVQKLILSDCKLRAIQKNAFTGLDILIYLDLSKNSFITLNSEAFKNTPRIRQISLNNNQIERLEDGLFNNLIYLQTVVLSNNRIAEVGLTAFFNLPRLTSLKLDGNELEHLEVDAVSGLTALRDFDLTGNRWKCECNLKPLVNWTKGKRLNTTRVSCAGPLHLEGRRWDELSSSDFACVTSL